MRNDGLCENMSTEEIIENTVLGCMIKNYHMLQTACEDVSSKFFSTTSHRQLFDILKSIYDSKKKHIDIYAVNIAIQNHKSLSEKFVQHVYDSSSLLKFKHHLDLLVCTHDKKHFKKFLTEMTDTVDKVATIQDIIPAVVKGALSADSSIESSVLSVKQILSSDPFKLMARIQDMQKNPEIAKRQNISTGFKDLDNTIGGLSPSNMVVLAARPSMGKTALALNIALNVCKKGDAIGIISIEMSSDQIVYRMLSTLSGVNATNITTGILDKDEFHAVQSAGYELGKLPIYIEDDAKITIDKLYASARKMKHLHNIKVLVIDYLQLIASSKGTSDYNRQQEISNISRSIKMMAKDLGICILCLSQLSRKVEERVDKKPKMSDLRESGSIEQDADQVLLIFRPEYYMTEEEKVSNSDISIPQIFVSKNRHGKTGEIRLTFKYSTLAFTNYEDVPENIYDISETECF